MLEKIFLQNNKIYWKSISIQIIEQHLFEEFLPLFFHSDKKISQRASAYFMTIVDCDADSLLPFQEQICSFLTKNPNVPQRRNIMRWLQFVEVDEHLEGIVLDKALEYLENPTEEIATKCYCMEIACHFAKKFPELTTEIQSLIEFNLELKSSAAISARGKRSLTKLKRITTFLNQNSET